MPASGLLCLGALWSSLWNACRNIRHRRYKPGSKEDPDAHDMHDGGKSGHMRSYGDSAHAHDGV